MPGTRILCGRSGTGKSSVLLSRMVQLEAAALAAEAAARGGGGGVDGEGAVAGELLLLELARRRQHVAWEAGADGGLLPGPGGAVAPPPRPRQLLVTRSARLAAAMRAKLRAALATARGALEAADGGEDGHEGVGDEGEGEGGVVPGGALPELGGLMDDMEAEEQASGNGAVLGRCQGGGLARLHCGTRSAQGCCPRAVLDR
jgi:hypothetical protein